MSLHSPLPSAFRPLPAPGHGDSVIVGRLPACILDILGQIDGDWYVRTSRGDLVVIERAVYRMDAGLSWIARPAPDHGMDHRPTHARPGHGPHRGAAPPAGASRP